MKFQEIPSSESRVVPWGRPDGRTDTIKLIISCRKFAKAPKEQRGFKWRTWGYYSSWVWRCVTHWSVPDVSKDLDAWRSRHYVLHIVGDRLLSDAMSIPEERNLQTHRCEHIKKVLLRA